MYIHGGKIGPEAEQCKTSTHENEVFDGIMGELAMQDAEAGKTGLQSAYTTGMTILLGGNVRPIFITLGDDD